MRDAQSRRQPAKLGIIAAGHNDKPILCRINRVWHNAGMAITHPAGADLGIQPIGRLVGQHCNLTVKKRAINMLALASPGAIGQRRQRRIRRKHASKKITHRNADLDRPTPIHSIGLAGNTHQAAHALNQKIITRTMRIGSGLAKSGDRTINKSRVDRRQRPIIKPVFCQTSGPEIFDQNIGFGGQITHQRTALSS